MLKILREQWRAFMSSLEGIDDVQGEIILALKNRVAQLESDVAALRAVMPKESDRIEDP